jgi:hypothetical protein
MELCNGCLIAVAVGVVTMAMALASRHEAGLVQARLPLLFPIVNMGTIGDGGYV